MAKKEDEAQKESSKNAQVLTRASQFSEFSHMGVWGNSASSWAPVTGMITNGYSEGNGDVHISVMNNWSDDP